MTRVMNTLSNQQKSKSKTVFHDHCQTEIEIKQKNISRLIFVQSDDEDVEDQLTQNKLSQTLQIRRIRENSSDFRGQKKRGLSKQFKGDSKLLKPSLMKPNTDNQEDYQQVINYTTQPCEPISNVPQNKARKARKLKTKHRSIIFEELVEKRDKLRDKDIIYLQPEISKEMRCNQDLQKKPNQNREKLFTEQQIVIPKLQIANICFQMSDQQPQHTSFSQYIIKPEQFVTKQVHKSQIAQKGQSQNKNKAQNPKNINQTKQVIENIDITEVQGYTRTTERSQYLEQLLKNWAFNEEKIINVMLTPLLPGTKQIFQLQVFSEIAQKSYIFWLSMGQQMRLLMKANKLITLNRTTFQFHTFDPKFSEYLQTCTMTSNIDRSLFNMYKIQPSRNKKRMLATYNQTINIKNNKLIVMYFPKVGENNEYPHFYEDLTQKDLQTIYRQNQTDQIDFVMSIKMESDKKLKMMEVYNLRASEKSMEFKNSNGGMQVIIGKKQSKRYQIISGPGLSPLQIFGLAIVQIQT